MGVLPDPRIILLCNVFISLRGFLSRYCCTGTRVVPEPVNWSLTKRGSEATHPHLQFGNFCYFFTNSNLKKLEMD